MACLTILVLAPSAVPVAWPETPLAMHGEQLHYSINWPSGLSLGEAELTASTSGQGFDFTLNLDASVPGFAVLDRYHSQAKLDFCSVEFDRQILHGKRKTENKKAFDPVQGCVKDALDYLYFVRHELSAGRLPPPQQIFLGGEREIRVEFGGVQSINLNGHIVDTDRVNATFGASGGNVSFEIYFLKDAQRTPALVRVPLSLATFTMELVPHP